LNFEQRHLEGVGGRLRLTPPPPHPSTRHLEECFQKVREVTQAILSSNIQWRHCLWSPLVIFSVLPAFLILHHGHSQTTVLFYKKVLGINLMISAELGKHPGYFSLITTGLVPRVWHHWSKHQGFGVNNNTEVNIGLEGALSLEISTPNAGNNLTKFDQSLLLIIIQSLIRSLVPGDLNAAIRTSMTKT
jgi:hypothetical protein